MVAAPDVDNLYRTRYFLAVKDSYDFLNNNGITEDVKVKK